MEWWYLYSRWMQEELVIGQRLIQLGMTGDKLLWCPKFVWGEIRPVVSEQWWSRNFWLLFYWMEFVSAEEILTWRGAGQEQSLIGCKSRYLIRSLRWAINATTALIQSTAQQLERATYVMNVWQVTRAESSSRWCGNIWVLCVKDDADRPTPHKWYDESSRWEAMVQ